MKHLKFIALILGLALTQQLTAKPFYIIDMITFKDSEQCITNYTRALNTLSQKYGGNLIVNPIQVVDQIKTTVTPDYTSDFSFRYILITRFENKKLAKSFNSDNKTMKFREAQSLFIDEQSILLSSTMMPLPGMPDFPEISNELQGGDSSFILVNAIKMKKSPGAIFKMMKYFKRNYPSITDSGTNYFSTFKVNTVLIGEFDFQMLFLTQWKSMTAFNDLHNTSEFKKNVHLRNSSFVQFTEGVGEIK